VVAGRLAEKYARPVLVISCDAVGGKLAVGSGRSGGRVDLHAALGECAERLTGFGGHRAAAGLKIDPDQIDAFRADFCEAVLQQLSHDTSEPEILIDAEAALGQLTLETVSQIEQMAPFGMGNARPVLCASGVGLVEPSRRMGGGDRHLTARLSQHGVTLRAVAFGQGEWCDELNGCEGPIDVAYRPVINEFRGRRNVELQIVDWRPALTPAPLTPAPLAADRG
jgi:single-stranded-DNA-specific exonuclease